jgi:hypothetical protein
MGEDEPEPEPLSNEEREALRALPREAAPPSALERRVVRELTRRGLLRSPASTWRGAVLAAGLLLSFAAGHISAGRSADISPASAAGKSWLLLLRGAPPEDNAPIEARIASMREWAREVRHAGVGIDGARLASGAEWVGAANAPAESDLSGYFLLRGVDRERALAIARSCPLLDWGGRIELRRVASAPGPS